LMFHFAHFLLFSASTNRQVHNMVKYPVFYWNKFPKKNHRLKRWSINVALAGFLKRPQSDSTRRYVLI